MLKLIFNVDDIEKRNVYKQANALKPNDFYIFRALCNHMNGNKYKIQNEL